MNTIKKLKQKITSGSSFKKDVLWTLSTQILVLVIAFGITKGASNILSINEFGQYNVIRRSVSVLSFVMLAGMGITLPRYLAIYQGKQQYRRMIDLTTCSLIFVCTISIIVLLIGQFCPEFLIQIITGSSDYELYWLAFAYAFGMSISTLLIAYYRGINDFKNYSITQVSFQLLLFISLFIIPQQNVKNIFFSWFLATTIFTILYFIIENHKNKFIIFKASRVKQFGPMMRTIAVYSTPRLVGDFFLFSFSAFPVIYLSHKSSMEDVAFFSVGLTIVNMAAPLFSFLGVVLLPYVSSAISNGKFNEAKSLIRRLTWGYIILAIVVTIVFCFFMPLAIKIFFSPDYIISKNISCILMLSLLPQSMYLLYRNPIDAASTIPYNTIILGISCALLFFLFSISSSLIDFSYSFVAASTLQGLLSLIVWAIISGKISRTKSPQI